MSDPRHLLQSGWVLHSRPYLNTSAIVDFFTREQGRVACVARGARRPKSGFRVMLQPFRPLLVSWSARHELGRLISVEPDGQPAALVGPGVMSGLYLNELLLRLLRPSDAHPILFDDYAATLRRLALSGGPEPALRVFEKRLLEHLGYGLNLTHDFAGNQPIVAEGRYAYQIERGAMPAVPGDAEVTVAGASLLKLASEHLDDEESLRDARLLLRQALARYLGDSPLKSRRVFRAMRRYTSV